MASGLCSLFFSERKVRTDAVLRTNWAKNNFIKRSSHFGSQDQCHGSKLQTQTFLCGPTLYIQTESYIPICFNHGDIKLWTLRERERERPTFLLTIISLGFCVILSIIFQKFDGSPPIQLHGKHVLYLRMADWLVTAIQNLKMVTPRSGVLQYSNRISLNRI